MDVEVYGTHCYEIGGVIHRNTGKTECTNFELTLHLTGMYPDWWEGKRFDRAIRAVASGQTAKTTRDFIQAKLFGLHSDCGTGMIPKDKIIRTTPKHGLAEAYDAAYVRHIGGGTSRLHLKSYDQGIEAYYGTEEEVQLLDEEPPLEIYTQALIRTMTTGGIVMLSMTPLLGLTPLIKEWMENNCVNPEVLRAA